MDVKCQDDNKERRKVEGKYREDEKKEERMRRVKEMREETTRQWVHDAKRKPRKEKKKEKKGDQFDGREASGIKINGYVTWKKTEKM